MDKRAELLSKLQNEFNFDRMVIVGIDEANEELHVMTTQNISDAEGILILLDGIAFLTTADTPELTAH